MSTRLLLVRHGEIDANLNQRWHGSTDSDLTALGSQQARLVAEHLARVRPNVAAVYASPLRRAHQTAQLIATALHVPLHERPGLVEYGIGVLENETFANLMGRHRFFEQVDADLDWAPPGGESIAAVATRVVAAWRAIASAHPGGEAVVVSHGAAIGIGLGLLLHEDVRSWARYRSRNASVSELELDPTPRLLAFDLVDHLG